MSAPELSVNVFHTIIQVFFIWLTVLCCSKCQDLVDPMSQPDPDPTPPPSPNLQHIQRPIGMSDLSATRPLLLHRHEVKPFAVTIITAKWNNMWPRGVRDNARTDQDFGKRHLSNRHLMPLWELRFSRRRMWRFSSGMCLIMEALSTSEQSSNFYQITRRNNAQNRHLHNLFRVWCLNVINLYTMQINV
jgi:hypothetical protein